MAGLVHAAYFVVVFPGALTCSACTNAGFLLLLRRRVSVPDSPGGLFDILREMHQAPTPSGHLSGKNAGPVTSAAEACSAPLRSGTRRRVLLCWCEF